MKRKIYFSVLILIVLLCISTVLNAEDVPLINPLNDMEAYKDLKHSTSDSINISYEDEEGNSIKKTVRGEYWYYEVPDIKDTDKVREDFIEYINTLSGKILFHSDRKIYFKVAAGNDIIWWGEARFYKNEYRVDVIKEWNLIPGKIISNQVGGDIKHWVFKTTYEGNNFISFKVTADSGEFTFKSINANKDMGDYEREFSYSAYINGNNDNHLDNIPQEKGEFYWIITEKDADSPVNISIKIEELAELPVIKYGEELGALRVEDVAWGRVSVEPAGGVEIKHPDNPLFNEDRTSQGDRTSKGDIIFWLPPGYWKVRVTPKASNSEEYETQMIPVNAGEMTILEIPSFLNTVFRGSKGLEIINTREKDGQGVIICKYTDEDKNKSPISPENVEVYEGGEKGEIIDIRAVEDLANVVLLLDSSGSMKGQMEATITTARDFIRSLPENTNTQVIDFDTKPKLLGGETREEVLKNLEVIKADGATALYDTILRGIDLLKGESCPVLLVFTDGVDANWDDTGPGSTVTKDEVLTAVKESGIPLYTIGFGPGHDNSTLTELADISGGSYYPADNQTVLADVFQEIKDNISYSYQITYNRPPGEDVADSDVPVVSFMIDRSGSMGAQSVGDSEISRLEVVKSLLRKFILELPEKSMTQLSCFDDFCCTKQILTDNKVALLQALGEIEKKGGTNILLSVESAVASLRKINSTKKILIYVTDEALEVSKGEENEFEQLLKVLKKEEIGVLWVGLGLPDKEDAFAYAAEVSGGDYLIADDIDLLKTKFEQIMKNIKEAPEDEVKQIPLRIVIKEKSDQGIANMASAGTKVSFSLMESTPTEAGKDERESGTDYLDNISYRVGLPFHRYKDDDIKEISQESIPEKGILIIKKIPLEASASNQALLVKADQALFITEINGVEVPRGKKLLALSLEFNHILPEQEVIVYPDGSSHPSSWVNSGSTGEKVITKIPYLIPDLSSHLFLNYNNSSMYPVSQATWITDNPLLPPGENSILVQPEEKIKGLCLFMIDDEPLDQASLHFYDTDYGHISLELVGEIDRKELILEELPTRNPEKLSETFDFTVTGVKDVEAIQSVEAGKDCIFRIVEGNFTTRVQALLDIKPAEHFFLKFSTVKGDFNIPLSQATALVPHGFSKATKLAPGSTNKVRFVFQVPEVLARQDPGQLFIELRKEDVLIPLGEVTERDHKEKELLTGDGIKMQVNELSRYYKQVVADLTLFDEPDGYATQLNNPFVLVRDDISEEDIEPDDGEQELIEKKGLGNFNISYKLDSEYIVTPGDTTEDLLFGYTNETAVYDGTNRRVILFFRMPSGWDDHKWTLQSEFFPDLVHEVSLEKYTAPELLVDKLDVSGKEDKFTLEIKGAIHQAIKDYQISKAMKEEKETAPRFALDTDEPLKEPVPVPPYTAAGKQQLREIDSITEALELMKGLNWLPSPDEIWRYRYSPRYSPAAVLNQGWGTENDLVSMMEILLLRLGYAPERKEVKITGKGYERLQEMSGINQIKIEELPALSYRDEEEEYLLVIPFMEDISQVSELVEPVDNDREINKASREATLGVYLRVIPLNEGRNQQVDKIGSALAGKKAETDHEEINVLHEKIALDTLSKDALDLGYIVTGKGTGDLYTVLVETAEQKFVGDKTVDTGEYQIIGVKVEIRHLSPNEHIVYENDFEEGETPAGIFHSLAINLPDINGEGVQKLQAAGKKIHDSAENPDEISTLRWYTRTIIGRFLAAQSEYERKLAAKLGLTVGRTDKARCLMVTVKSGADDELVSSIDLIRVENEVHNGDEDAVAAFNILSGLYASKLEAEVLPGKDAVGLFEVWQQLPEDTHLVAITNKNKKEIISYMEDNEFPGSMIDRIEETKNEILIPAKPALIEGQERWAWLEINPDDYRTIAVLNTGEHGALLEHALGNWKEDSIKFAVGALVGVDAALWSMSAYSLIMDDYEEIKKEAEDFALELAKKLKGLGSTSTKSLDVGPVSISYNFAAGKPEATGNLLDLSYAGGFAAGVDLYFSLVE